MKAEKQFMDIVDCCNRKRGYSEMGRRIGHSDRLPPELGGFALGLL
jgi:hypothetical protein